MKKEQQPSIRRGEMAFIFAIVLGLILGILIKRVKVGILIGIAIGFLIVLTGWARSRKRSK